MYLSIFLLNYLYLPIYQSTYLSVSIYLSTYTYIILQDSSSTKCAMSYHATLSVPVQYSPPKVTVLNPPTPPQSLSAFKHSGFNTSTYLSLPKHSTQDNIV